MFCPFCKATDTKVIDSRLVASGSQVRRRRECLVCKERYTTFEAAELLMPRVIKKDGRRCPFDQEKLLSGVRIALDKRSISEEDLAALLTRILHKVSSIGEREVASEYIGDVVLEELLLIDEVAYVRFASVYRSFKNIEAFKEIILGLEQQYNNKLLEEKIND